MRLPSIIQGGMGAGVSGWQLARAVASHGGLGVVSGTALDTILTRRLQVGDPGGHMRRALESFPDCAVARWIVDRYYVAGGKSPDRPFRSKPMIGQEQPAALQQLIVAANFVEVFLAREGHDGVVGINYLEKIQTPTLPSIYGAMLAGVDVVIMGAGIPKDIPGVLDALAEHHAASLRLHVTGAAPDALYQCAFDPRSLFADPPALRRPLFFPIVASDTLASMMVKRANGRVDGLIVERPTAGGHNAPPRGKAPLNDDGEPVYGPRDVPDLGAIGKLGVPFWLAGSCGSPERLAAAEEAGAAGVQVGTLFAFCAESGIHPDIKRQVIAQCTERRERVRTDPVASPTGFPFKVLALAGTNSEADACAARCRVCDLGYLREPYERPGRSLGWRCAAEPVDDYVSKGGDPADTVGRKCLCNGLVANIGLEQVRADGERERPLLTCGDDTAAIARLVRGGDSSYTAADVLRYLRGASEPARCAAR